MAQIEESYLGGRLAQFDVGGQSGYLIAPSRPVDSERRWIWIAPGWLALPRPDEAAHHQFYVQGALAKGFHLAGVEMGITYGSPWGMNIFQQLYERMVQEYKLNPRARLIAQSNGGLMHYNWAARHPDCVERIFAIYPVVDLRTWPPEGLAKACTGHGYDMTPAELEARLGEFNPIEQLAPLAARGVTIFHIHGDSDTMVPLEPNSGELSRRYLALGGSVDLQVLEGEGHRHVPKFYESQRGLAFLLE